MHAERVTVAGDAFTFLLWEGLSLLDNHRDRRCKPLWVSGFA